MAWTAPRTWNPGETVTAALMNAHVRDNLNVLKTRVLDTGELDFSQLNFLTALGLGKLIFARSTADFTKNNNTTFGDVTGLVFAIGANETWAFEFVTHGVSPAAADIKFAVTFPASPTAVRYGAQTRSNTFSSSTGTAGAAVVIETGAVEETFVIQGLVRNGANAGNVQLQMAQQAATVGDTIIRADSIVLAFRVA